MQKIICHTDIGSFNIELFSNKQPHLVDNFLCLVKNGMFESVSFKKNPSDLEFFLKHGFELSYALRHIYSDSLTCELGSLCCKHKDQNINVSNFFILTSSVSDSSYIPFGKVLSNFENFKQSKKILGIDVLTQQRMDEIQIEIFRLITEYAKLSIDKYINVFASTIRYGVFQGVKLDYYNLDALCSDLSLFAVSKFTGQYEIEIESWVKDAIKQNYNKIINIGCSDGYYALGFAAKMPHSKIIAYEQNEVHRLRFEKNIALNSLHNIDVHGFCDIDQFKAILDNVSENILLFLDIEGEEINFLDPNQFKNLKFCDIIVELHDFAYKDIEKIISSRFSNTHKIEIVGQIGRNPHFAELIDLSEPVKLPLFSEYRPPNMKWMRLKAKKNRR